MSSSLESDTTTHGIRIQVLPRYLPDHTDSEENRFVFSYRITITNNSDHWVKLVRRHWIIINADGQRSEVKGSGVVGFQPELDPGESHEYESLCPIDTDWGTMEGSYEMQDDKGNLLDIKIGRFYLAVTSDETVESSSKQI